MLATIPPEIWPAIESTVLDLMIAAYDAGYSSGAGLERATPADPTLAWLLGETRRRWAAELRAGRQWIAPTAEPASPAWLRALQIGARDGD